jgi:hypothetical protein
VLIRLSTNEIFCQHDRTENHNFFILKINVSHIIGGHFRVESVAFSFVKFKTFFYFWFFTNKSNLLNTNELSCNVQYVIFIGIFYLQLKELLHFIFSYINTHNIHHAENSRFSFLYVCANTIGKFKFNQILMRETRFSHKN